MLDTQVSRPHMLSGWGSRRSSEGSTNTKVFPTRRQAEFEDLPPRDALGSQRQCDSPALSFKSSAHSTPVMRLYLNFKLHYLELFK